MDPWRLESALYVSARVCRTDIGKMPLYRLKHLKHSAEAAVAKLPVYKLLPLHVDCKIAAE